MNGSGSGWSPMVGVGTSGVEPSGCITIDNEGLHFCKYL